MKPQELAIIMHNAYESHSRVVGWKTQKKCQVSWNELPVENKEAMIRTAQTVLKKLETSLCWCECGDSLECKPIHDKKGLIKDHEYYCFGCDKTFKLRLQKLGGR